MLHNVAFMSADGEVEYSVVLPYLPRVGEFVILEDQGQEYEVKHITHDFSKPHRDMFDGSIDFQITVDIEVAC